MEKATLRILRVRAYKQAPKRTPGKEFVGWKDRVKFVGEIECGKDKPKRIFKMDPAGAGRLIAINVRDLKIDKVALIDDIDGIEQERRRDGSMSPDEQVMPLGDWELQSMRMAMIENLGAQKVA